MKGCHLPHRRNTPTLGRVFKAPLVCAGLDESVVFHWLRHTHASPVAAAGRRPMSPPAWRQHRHVMSTCALAFDADHREDDQRR